MEMEDDLFSLEGVLYVFYKAERQINSFLGLIGLTEVFEEDKTIVGEQKESIFLFFQADQ
jgi:hypothetical protein